MVTAVLLCLCVTPFTMVYALVGIFRNPIRWKKYFPFLLISIFVLGYAYVPTGAPDLTRYIAIVKHLQHMDLWKAIAYMDDNLYVENLFFWLVAAIGDLQLLAAVPITIVYYVAIYILCDTASEFGKEKYIPVLLIFQMMMMPFVSILNNVRCITSFSIVILATYLDIVKKTKKLYLIPLYILPCYFHSAAIILVALRLAVPLAKRMKIVVVMLCLLLPNLVDILYKNMAFISNNLIKNLINNVYWYYHDDLRSEYSQRIANSGADVVQRIIFFSFVIGMIIIILRLFDSFSLERKTYNTFVLLLCVATLGLQRPVLNGRP